MSKLNSRSKSEIEWDANCSYYGCIMKWLRDFQDEMSVWISESGENIEIQNPEKIPEYIKYIDFEDEMVSELEKEYIIDFLKTCVENSKKTGGIAYIDLI